MNKAKIANIDGLTKPELDYLCEHDYIKVGDKYYISKERASELVAQLQANVAEQSESNCNIPLVTVSYFDKIQKGFKKLQEDCSEVSLVGFCQKDEIPDEAHREEFEEEFDHEYQLIHSDGYDEASFWGDIYLQLDDILYMRFNVYG